MKININPKFRDLLPPLADEEFQQLEQSILASGINESIKLWQGQIVDGHNRYNISQKHDLPFTTSEMSFADENEVCEWIYINQLGRRNLSDHQRNIFIGRLFNLRKAKHGGDRKSRVHDDTLIQVQDNQQASQRTADVIAKEFGVSPATVKRAGKIAEKIEAKPELEKPFLEGQITQKEILEQEQNEQEATTKFGKYHSEKITKKLQELQNLIAQAQSSFKANGLVFADYAPRISRLNLQPLKREAKELADA